MLFIYTERGGAKEYAVLRDGCQTQRVEGIIAEAYKQALGAPKFLWPDFYDRLTYDANEVREDTGTDTANATLGQLERAITPGAIGWETFQDKLRGQAALAAQGALLEVTAQLPEIIEASVRKVLNEKEKK